MFGEKKNQRYLSREVSQHYFRDTPYIVSSGKLSFQNRCLNLTFAILFIEFAEISLKEYIERKGVKRKGELLIFRRCFFLLVPFSKYIYNRQCIFPFLKDWEKRYYLCTVKTFCIFTLKLILVKIFVLNFNMSEY